MRQQIEKITGETALYEEHGRGQHPDQRGVVGVAVEELPQVRDRLRGLAHGADEFVGKPYDRGYVVDRARELLRQRQAFRQSPAAAAASQRASVLLIDALGTFKVCGRSPCQSRYRR